MGVGPAEGGPFPALDVVLGVDGDCSLAWVRVVLVILHEHKERVCKRVWVLMILARWPVLAGSECRKQDMYAKSALKSKTVA